MSARSERLQDLIGVRSTSVEPARRLLDQRGITVYPKTISSWRTENRSGKRTQVMLDAAATLLEDTSQSKTGYLSNLIDVGLGNLQMQAGPNSDRFLSTGFTGTIADELGVKEQTVRNAVLSMRADIGYTEAHTRLPIEARDSFDDVVRDFLERTQERADHSVPVRDVVDLWDTTGEGSITDFYRLLYLRGRRAIASWLPYELPFLADYFHNHPRELSRMDELVLRATVRKTSPQVLVGEIRRTTGVPVSRTTLAVHRSLLISGRPFQSGESIGQAS